MIVFQYNTKAPCPTDRYVIPIYKEYKSFMANTLNVWKRDLVSQLVMIRQFVDFNDSRISLKKSKDGVLPIISFKPIVGLNFDEEVHEYISFFEYYEILKRQIIAEVFSKISLRNSDDPKDRAKEQDSVFLSASVNALKILIASFNNKTFNADIFANVIGDVTSQDAANWARALGVNHAGGIDFDKGGLLQDYRDSDLIGSFYKYVRKVML